MHIDPIRSLTEITLKKKFMKKCVQYRFNIYLTMKTPQKYNCYFDNKINAHKSRSKSAPWDHIQD